MNDDSDLILDEASTDCTGSNDVLTEVTTSITEVTPQHILSFAKCILIGLAVLFVVGMGIECFYPDGKVFEACKLTLPPLATLVIGYYFGTAK